MNDVMPGSDGRGLWGILQKAISCLLWGARALVRSVSCELTLKEQSA